MNEVPPSIGDYAIIGDCKSAALIARDGSLEWLCWPRFDSTSVFAAILDPERGGRWQLSPCGAFSSARRYITDTNVLETRFETETGIVTLTDFMPLADDSYRRAHLVPDHAIVRLLRCERGVVQLHTRFAPRPGFGAKSAYVKDRGKLGLRVSSGHGMVALHTSVHLDVDDDVAHARFETKTGDEITFILTYAESSPEVMPIAGDSGESLERTIQWWQQWSSTSTYAGAFRDAVMRSLLTLKLLEFPASGAFVAAPTTSLPERLGGKLNWDYRYCWLRDASFAIAALLGTGYLAESEAFTEWLLHATRQTQPKLMVMYDVYGNLAPPERVVRHLAGHRHSVPVNTGNGARDQTQLDTYGEVVAGAAMLLKHVGRPADKETSKVLIGFGRFVCKHWHEPDAGIWEDRGERVVHTHSLLASWKALDALLDLAERQLIRSAPVELFEKTQRAIRETIETDGWDPAAQTYTSQPGKLKLDASLLRMALVGFDEPTSNRMMQTCERVCQTLGAGVPLLYRNLPDDGKPNEGAFAACGFWRAEYLAIGGGSIAEAESAFTALLNTGNDVGLFAEETEPATGALLGNFPQALTHLGLINAALAIQRRRRQTENQ